MLIERSSALASLEGLLSEALDGSGRLVFLGGEAGVGKTTLAAALAGSGAGPAGGRGPGRGGVDRPAAPGPPDTTGEE